MFQDGSVKTIYVKATAQITHRAHESHSDTTLLSPDGITNRVHNLTPLGAHLARGKTRPLQLHSTTPGSITQFTEYTAPCYLPPGAYPVNYFQSRFDTCTSIGTAQLASYSTMKVSNNSSQYCISQQVGGQAVLGRQLQTATPWLTERHGYDPTWAHIL